MGLLEPQVHPPGGGTGAQSSSFPSRFSILASSDASSPSGHPLASIRDRNSSAAFCIAAISTAIPPSSGPGAAGAAAAVASVAAAGRRLLTGADKNRSSGSLPGAFFPFSPPRRRGRAATPSSRSCRTSSLLSATRSRAESQGRRTLRTSWPMLRKACCSADFLGACSRAVLNPKSRARRPDSMVASSRRHWSISCSTAFVVRWACFGQGAGKAGATFSFCLSSSSWAIRLLITSSFELAAPVNSCADRSKVSPSCNWDIKFAFSSSRRRQVSNSSRFRSSSTVAAVSRY
mmetsp:Transcript_15509/g.39254  ORF Transcript_15509/g.39254 Transcript_15509/m.39254 type:complete len:290 (-) Transcript_15509:229-1098(-)